jgi:hypothetical protein
MFSTWLSGWFWCTDGHPDSVSIGNKSSSNVLARFQISFLQAERPDAVESLRWFILTGLLPTDFMFLSASKIGSLYLGKCCKCDPTHPKIRNIPASLCDGRHCPSHHVFPSHLHDVSIRQFPCGLLLGSPIEVGEENNRVVCVM